MIDVVSRIVCETNQERARFKAFAALIKTPGSLATGVTLPADCDLYVSTSSILAAPTELATADGRYPAQRHLYAPAQAANVRWHVGRHSRSVVIKKAVAAPGNVKIYIRDGMGKQFLIGQ